MIWNFRLTKMLILSNIQYHIPLEVRTDRYRVFTYVLRQAKTVIFSLYNFPGRIHHFFCKSTLYINGFSNSDQFDSIYLDYASQLVESVITQGKYEDNMHLFNSSSAVCYIGNKRLFMKTNFIKTNKLRPVQKPFNILGTPVA